MAISQQDLFVNLLLPNKNGFFLDIGAGDGEFQPCQTNTAWLEELGWKGILLEYEKKYCDHCRNNNYRNDGCFISKFEKEGAWAIFGGRKLNFWASFSG